MFDYHKLYHDFVTPAKSLLIAPAGYGKTHTIAECLKYLKEEKGIEHQLILTHTHAGVASIKEKVAKVSPDCKYYIETISSFAQKYVEAYYCGTLPEQGEDGYFPFIIRKAAELFIKSPIKEVIGATYKGLFVDEYQDCTISQHELLMRIAELLPVHILGDPLQGIFTFNNENLVDLESGFTDYVKLELPEHWRWKNVNPQLGNFVENLRTNINNHNPIYLSNYSALTLNTFEEKDLYIPGSDYYLTLSRIIDSDSSLLIIYPDSANINARIKIVKKYKNRISLVESIDNKEFYVYSKLIDECTAATFYQTFYQIGNNFFKSSDFNNWFSDKGCKNKQDQDNKEVIEPIKSLCESCASSYSLDKFLSLIRSIKYYLKITCYRKELFSELCKAIKMSILEKTTVLSSMKSIRNIRRRVGRKILGKCIGTTLLTKGLEFDTVVVLNAHKFTDSKNLYVALTRASKRLIVFTNTKILSPSN